MHERVLHQFPISHYCEKVRWVLDHKRLPYRTLNQLPGLHVRANTKLTGRATVPLLRDGHAAVSGSHNIALHLEVRQQGPSLLPRSAAGRALHDALVKEYDDVVGPAVRRYLYRSLLPRTALFHRVFFGGYGAVPKLFGSVMACPVSKVIAKMYDVHAHEAAALPELFRRAADGIEAQLRTGSPYLIDDRLSLADITVASLYGPLIGPEGSPWSLDTGIPELQALRAELTARPIGQYITARYAERLC
jgi:glutathione S-transferase